MEECYEKSDMEQSDEEGKVQELLDPHANMYILGKDGVQNGNWFLE